MLWTRIEKKKSGIVHKAKLRGSTAQQLFLFVSLWLLEKTGTIVATLRL